MKTTEIILIAGLGLIAFSKFGKGASTDVNGLYPIQSDLGSSASASYPMKITKAEQRVVRRSDVNPESYSQIQAPEISIKEDGKQYVPSYKVVDVGTKGKQLSGGKAGTTNSGKVIKFKSGGSMGMSTGFAKLASKYGLV